MTLWLPAVLGVGVVYHPSPLDLTSRSANWCATTASRSCFRRRLSCRRICARCSPEDFGSVQFVMAGAEKLPERLALAFEDRFGIRPLEGYGARNVRRWWR